MIPTLASLLAVGEQQHRIAMTPIPDRQRQNESLLVLYGSLTQERTPSVFPDYGEVSDSTTGIRWSWAIRPKRGNVSITLLDNRLSLGGVALTYRIPLGVLDINDMGLLAQDSGGTCYLCRRKHTNRHRPKSRLGLKTRMRDVDSVQPQCPTCSSRQGAELSRFSRQMKKEHGLE